MSQPIAAASKFPNYRPFLVYGISVVVVFGALLLFISNGWPGVANSCLDGGSDACFCERVDIAAVAGNRPGVRQPSNTWSNLYALITALAVAWLMFKDRRALAGAAAPNLIRSRSLLADLFVFAVFFLGFGSMWFHASITQWGGKFDGMSMYVFVGYMVSYTWYRLVPVKWSFVLIYALIVVIFTLLHNHVDSVVLIAINVGLYAVLELIILGRWLVLFATKRRSLADDWYLPLCWWLGAVGSFGLAFLFWQWGVREHAYCRPDSWWQWHGLWHLFAGVMAMFIYYYWRRLQPVEL